MNKILSIVIMIGVLAMANGCANTAGEERMILNPQYAESGHRLGIGLPEYQLAVESGEIESLHWQQGLIADGRAGGDSGDE